MTPTVPRDDGEGAGAERDLGEQPQDLLLVAAQGARAPGERADVEPHLLAEAVERLHGPAGEVEDLAHVLHLLQIFWGTTWK